MIDVTTTPTSRRRSSARAGRVIAGVGVVILVLVVCVWVPGIVGTAAAAVLPWWGLALAILVALALVLARRVTLVLLAPILVWALAMLPSAPGLAAGAPAQSTPLEIVSQNVRAHSGGAAASAAELADMSADVIALTELDGDSLEAARETLAAAYPHSYAIGTVAVWSRYPIADAQALTLGLDWKRALRVVVNAPDGDLAVYVMHAASVRPGVQQERDTMLSGIADAVASDSAESIVVVGDFNAASADPALSAVRSRLDWVRPTDGTLGLTWPAALPLARIDHVFVRGLTVLESTTARVGNSDHLATVTTLAR
ncbi:vancomycin resistance protein VanJ [Microbacterium phyllosphaerae]|uniref:Vancomycin resistance protein VanJ n=1 Tax=Microbacterium phyllosphaerae TaxID=124798 RepID=A0ABS4WQB6_9MICO|nr:endonuclease/exonuclease/phosphatase family protein [Microbacterium phyllosphaerae]MBP2378346.1 vancomycin resistance protein VanJ [Microbacterium phyllosphaerae]